MKKLLLSIITLLAFAPIFAVSIDDVIGQYSGVLNVSLYGMGMDPTNDVVVNTVKEEGGQTFKLVLENFSFMGESIGNIEVGGVSVDSEGNISAPTVTLDKTEVGLGKLPTTLNGTINASEANLKLLVKWEPSGNYEDPEWVDIDITYDGKRVASSINNALAGAVKLVQNGNILSLEGAAIKSFAIYNINGSTVAAQKHHATAINIDALPYGVYVIKLTTDKNQIVTRKVYKK
jgi:hypothetical protein